MWTSDESLLSYMVTTWTRVTYKRVDEKRLQCSVYCDTAHNTTFCFVLFCFFHSVVVRFQIPIGDGLVSFTSYLNRHRQQCKADLFPPPLWYNEANVLYFINTRFLIIQDVNYVLNSGWVFTVNVKMENSSFAHSHAIKPVWLSQKKMLVTDTLVTIHHHCIYSQVPEAFNLFT